MARWILVLALSLLSGISCAVADSIPAGRQSELRNLLIQDCGSCHGLTMRGGLGPALLPKNMSERPRETMIDTVMYGRPSTAMPPWNTMLSRDEAAWMIDQLRRGINAP